jgi:hypothetical protein
MRDVRWAAMTAGVADKKTAAARLGPTRYRFKMMSSASAL